MFVVDLLTIFIAIYEGKFLYKLYLNLLLYLG